MPPADAVFRIGSARQVTQLLCIQVRGPLPRKRARPGLPQASQARLEVDSTVPVRVGRLIGELAVELALLKAGGDRNTQASEVRAETLDAVLGVECAKVVM